MTDLTSLGQEVAAAVAVLLQAGRSGRVEVNVHPNSRRPFGKPVVFIHDSAVYDPPKATPAPGWNTGGDSGESR